MAVELVSAGTDRVLNTDSVDEWSVVSGQNSDILLRRHTPISSSTSIGAARP